MNSCKNISWTLNVSKHVLNHFLPNFKSSFQSTVSATLRIARQCRTSMHHDGSDLYTKAEFTMLENDEKTPAILSREASGQIVHNFT